MPSPYSPFTAAPLIRTVSVHPNGLREGHEQVVRVLDQRALPERVEYLDLMEVQEVVDAIRSLVVRGAPAIGVAAALGLAVTLSNASGGNGARARDLLDGYAERLIASRPTAVNLKWAVDRVRTRAESSPDHTLLADALDEAQCILDEDAAMCRRIGEHGVSLLRHGVCVMTHCNAGALATAGIGTALAPVYVAHERGLLPTVIANETRPLRQGARLTAWELTQNGIPVTVIPDSAAASLMAQGRVDVVFVGADRIAANGDTANKIGTYALALAARAHNIPFFVAAPWSTIDPETATGSDIPIEHRSAEELGVLPEGALALNPAFDVTPHSLITAFITDRGIVAPPFINLSLTLGATA